MIVIIKTETPLWNAGFRSSAKGCIIVSRIGLTFNRQSDLAQNALTAR